MEKETLTLHIDADGIRAYYNDDKMACDEQKRLLELLFGKDQLQPTQSKDVTERVKTFVDAVNELGNDNSLVQQYNMLYSEFDATMDADIIAYLKLRIIAAALNEGWKPQFTKDEWRYYPYFYFLTKEEYDNLSDKDKQRCVGRSGSNADADGWLVYASASNGSAYSNANYGVRLAFRTRELAEYAGKQFADIWADFLLKVSSDTEDSKKRTVVLLFSILSRTCVLRKRNTFNSARTLPWCVPCSWSAK